LFGKRGGEDKKKEEKSAMSTREQDDSFESYRGREQGPLKKNQGKEAFPK